MPEKKPVKKAAPKSKAAKPAKAKKAVKAVAKPKVAKKVVVAKAKTASLKTKTAPKAKATKKKQPKKFSTGEKCPESGLYEHFCKDKGENARIPLSKTETFPPCRTCGSVKWILVMAA